MGYDTITLQQQESTVCIAVLQTNHFASLLCAYQKNPSLTRGKTGHEVTQAFVCFLEHSSQH